MQLVPKYLLNNSVSLTANLAGEVTEYRTVYQRNINVYRGIDTSIQFNVLNADQKPVSILNIYTPKFKLYDENNRLIVERDGTVLETSTPSKVGHFSVTISENDLLNIPSQYLSYSVFLQKTSDNSKTILHSGTNFDAKGTIFVSKDEFPGPLDSTSVTTFTQDQGASDIFYSENIPAQPAINGNSALHTVAYYLDGAEGDIVIQGTLENNPTVSTFWVDIDTFTATTSDTLKYVNFNGVYSNLRIKHTSTVQVNSVYQNKITKVLVRN